MDDGWDRDDAGNIKVISASAFEASAMGGIVLVRLELVAGAAKAERTNLQLAMTPIQCDLMIERLSEVRDLVLRQSQGRPS